MTLQDLLTLVRQSGGRITKTRQAVLSIFLKADTPLSATHLLQALEKQKLTLNRTTIYRELDFLLAKNLIKEVKIARQPSLFELAVGHHHHLICTACQKIKTIAMEEVLAPQERQLARKEKFKVTGHSLEFYGLCDQCQ